MKLKTTTDTLTGKRFSYNCTSIYPVDGYDWIVPARLGRDMVYLDPARVLPRLLASLNNDKTYRANSARTAARRLASRLGCTLDYQRTTRGKHVTIYLPPGSEFDGNPGLDVLHHECELNEDIWPGVLADLEVLA